jgi:hypothetical protein
MKGVRWIFEGVSKRFPRLRNLSPKSPGRRPGTAAEKEKESERTGRGRTGRGADGTPAGRRRERRGKKGEGAKRPRKTKKRRPRGRRPQVYIKSAPGFPPRRVRTRFPPSPARQGGYTPG